MNLKPLAELKTTLDFHKDEKWPKALLPIAWHCELLCGFKATTDYAWELSSNIEASQVAEAFLEIHTDMSFADLVFLYKKSSKLYWGPLFFNEVLKLSARGQEASWLKLLENLKNFPAELLRQWQTKRLQFGDLRPLLSFTSSYAVDTFWGTLSEMNFSKSEWTQVIEWTTELLLMQKELSTLQHYKNKPREMLIKIKELRYPETTKKDQLEQEFWQKLPWPKNTEAEFRRHGDQTKTYVAMNFSTLQDLKKIAKELHNMTEQQESEH